MAALAATALVPAAATAQLSGAHVVAGHATVAAISPRNTLITQTTSRAIIDWNTFSIPAGSSAIIRQPSASADLLNVVTGGGAANIGGSLSANGNVYVVDLNGIAISPNAQITANELLLSTRGIGDNDFMAGKNDFVIPGNPNAALSLSGKIAVHTLVIVAPQITVHSSINTTPNASTLATGSSASSLGATRLTFDFTGDGLLAFSPAMSVSAGTATVSSAVSTGASNPIAFASSLDSSRSVNSTSLTICPASVGGCGGAPPPPVLIAVATHPADPIMPNAPNVPNAPPPRANPVSPMIAGLAKQAELAAINNAGMPPAPLRIVLSGAAVKEVLDNTINTCGIVEASVAVAEDGWIVLRAASGAPAHACR